jgi:predicted PurR-regulated permease PerM
MLLTSTYYLSLLLLLLLSLFQISRQLMEQAATIAAAREDTSETALSSWEKAVQKCTQEKVEKAMMEMKKHRISLEDSVSQVLEWV